MNPLLSLNPREYYNRFLSQGLRPDGRSLRETRTIQVQVGSISSAIGSATVKLGKTIIVCGIKAEIAAPNPYSPNQGYLVPNFDLSAMVCPSIKPGPPDAKSQIISERIFQTLSKFSLDKLIIVHGKAAWVLYVDLVCISDDGNLFDACITAVTESLKDCKIPTVSIDQDQILPNLNEFNMPFKDINMKSHTFLKIGKDWIADPTDLEEGQMDGTLTVLLSNGVINGLWKEGCVISVEEVDACIESI